MPSIGINNRCARERLNSSINAGGLTLALAGPPIAKGGRPPAAGSAGRAAAQERVSRHDAGLRHATAMR